MTIYLNEINDLTIRKKRHCAIIRLAIEHAPFIMVFCVWVQLWSPKAFECLVSNETFLIKKKLLPILVSEAKTRFKPQKIFLCLGMIFVTGDVFFSRSFVSDQQDGWCTHKCLHLDKSCNSKEITWFAPIGAPWNKNTQIN